MKRVALRGQLLNEVFPPPDYESTLSFEVTGCLLVAFGPADQHWWEYLNRIEEALEAAQAIDLDLLPALMLRARQLTAPAG